MTRLSHLALKKDKKIHDHLKLPIQMTQSTFLQNEKVSRLSRGNRGDEKKRTSKVIKLRYLFPEMVRQSSKGRRVIAATDYFTTATLQLYFILAMFFHTFPLPQWSLWLVICAVLKEANQTVKRPPSLRRPASLPCQSAILFPDSTVISQPSGAALPDLCLDLRLNSPSSSTSSSLESRLGPPLLIYEPFHTVLLPLETQPWPTFTRHSPCT